MHLVRGASAAALPHEGFETIILILAPCYSSVHLELKMAKK